MGGGKNKRKQDSPGTPRNGREVHKLKANNAEAQSPNVGGAGKPKAIDPKASAEQQKDSKPDSVTIDTPPPPVQETSGDDVGRKQETTQPELTASTTLTETAAEDGTCANTSAAPEAGEPFKAGGQKEAASVEASPAMDNQPIDVGNSEESSKEMEPEGPKEETTVDSQEKGNTEQPEEPDDGWELSSIDPVLDSDDDLNIDQASDVAVVGSPCQDLTDDSGFTLTEGAHVSANTQIIESQQRCAADIEDGYGDHSADQVKLDKLPEDATPPAVSDEKELGETEAGPEITPAPEEPTIDSTQSQDDSSQDSGTSDVPQESTQSSGDLPSTPATSASIVPEASIDKNKGENATLPEHIVESPNSGEPPAQEKSSTTKPKKKKKSGGKGGKTKNMVKETPVNSRTGNRSAGAMPKGEKSEPTPPSGGSTENGAPQTSASVENAVVEADGQGGDNLTKLADDPAPESKDSEDPIRAEEAEQGGQVTKEGEESHSEAAPGAAPLEEQDPQEESSPAGVEEEASKEQPAEGGNGNPADVPSEQPSEGVGSQKTPQDEAGSTEAPPEGVKSEKAASSADEGGPEATTESAPVDDPVPPDEAGSTEETPSANGDGPADAGEDASASEEAVVTENATPAEATPALEETVSTEEPATTDGTTSGGDTGSTGDAATGADAGLAEGNTPADDAGPVDVTAPVDEAVAAEEATPKEDGTPAEESVLAVEATPSGEGAPAEGNAPAEEAAPAESTGPAEENPPPGESVPAVDVPSAEEAAPVDPAPAEEAAPADEPAAADAGPTDEAHPLEAAAPAEETTPAETPAAAPPSPKSGSSGRKRHRRSSLFGLEYARPQRKRRQSDAVVPSTTDRSVPDSPRDHLRRRRYSEANYKTVTRPAEDERQHRRKSKTPSREIKKAKTEPIPHSADPGPSSSGVEAGPSVDKSSRPHRGERRKSFYQEPSPKQPPAMLRLFSMSGKSETKPPLLMSTDKDSKARRPTSSRHGSSRHHHRSPEEKEASKARREERRSKEDASPEPKREERRSRREEKRPATAPTNPPKASSSSRPKISSDRRRRSEQAQPPTLKSLAMSSLRKIFVN